MNSNRAESTTAEILIVDDTPENLRLLSVMLIEQGYQVRRVISGKLALDAAQVKPPDLILLDIMMPQINGYEVCQRLKANEQTCGIPVIFLSVLDEALDKVKAFAVGGADYITKPFQIEEVVARIEHQLTIQKLQKQLREQNRQLQQEIRISEAAMIRCQQAEIAQQKLNLELEARVEGRTKELKQANEHLLKLQTELRESLVQEKELNEFKSRIISTISHEYRTPLTTIATSAGILERYLHKLSQQKQSIHFQRIQSALKHLTSLVNDVLFLNKSELEKAKLNLTDLDLIAFCSELIEEQKLIASTKYTITFTHQGDCSGKLWDESKLRQILSNLLSNAIKYSPEGGLIEVQLLCQDQEIILEVKDHGIGIPVESQARLFESFHRGNNVGSIQGIGLGLSIVKKCVELYRGKITCHSEVGVGTLFRVALPLAKTEIYDVVKDTGTQGHGDTGINWMGI
ncbi:MAG: hybrid sensor histidine kinase/response regulator [Symploca sp. SIO3C6]|nr:hybrid sensor histidine kinase/response regulator [Symploca sp. SIO3C6]NET06739.1 hybrid sensor histidine kinase/response regulator [Symploca sp. SIO2B6]